MDLYLSPCFRKFPSYHRTGPSRRIKLPSLYPEICGTEVHTKHQTSHFDTCPRWNVEMLDDQSMNQTFTWILQRINPNPAAVWKSHYARFVGSTWQHGATVRKMFLFNRPSHSCPCEGTRAQESKNVYSNRVLNKF